MEYQATATNAEITPAEKKSDAPFSGGVYLERKSNGEPENPQGCYGHDHGSHCIAGTRKPLIILNANKPEVRAVILINWDA